MIELRGMTWDHPRGVDPLVAHATSWEAAHGVKIKWDARILEDFETYPLDDLTERYDLLVIDHPHVGMAAAHKDCLLPLDVPAKGQAVGGSNESYFYAGKQWALAIDAASQVSCRRTGSLDALPTSWFEARRLAHQGRVLLPLAPVHALMSFFTLCSAFEGTCATSGPQLIEPHIAEAVLELLAEFAGRTPPACAEMNPIDILEWMARDEQFIFTPLVYGYANYARDGFRPTRLEFGNIPGEKGSTLGGTGIAVSAKSPNRATAVAVAVDLASSATQCGVYSAAGGQPAHRDAWNHPTINAETHGFFRNTLATLDQAYVRPRFDGYIEFQHAAGELISQCIRFKVDFESTPERLNRLFAKAQGLE